jgi:hypothetical protein
VGIILPFPFVASRIRMFECSAQLTRAKTLSNDSPSGISRMMAAEISIAKTMLAPCPRLELLRKDTKPKGFAR